MKYNPTTAIRDLKLFLSRFGITLSAAAERVFLRAEQIGHEKNSALYDWVFLCAAVQEVGSLRSLMIRLGGDPTEAQRVLEGRMDEGIKDGDYDPYDPGSRPYSRRRHRGTNTTTGLADLIVSIAKRNRRQEVLDLDVLEALLEWHDHSFPVSENGNWADEALHTTYNTLAHIYGSFHPSLWVRFDDLRRHLGLFAGAHEGGSPAESAKILVIIRVKTMTFIEFFRSVEFSLNLDVFHKSIMKFKQ